ncbi:hypothetical protein HOY82DRAFT_371882 [Tuber indicum]|nr:hypothetical protein HOY82DRAFT_371882 [Tuber indicum]
MSSLSRFCVSQVLVHPFVPWYCLDIYITFCIMEFPSILKIYLYVSKIQSRAVGVNLGRGLVRKYLTLL